MPWAAIDEFRKWTAKRRRLLQGLIGVAVEGVASCVPGGALAVWSTKIIGEFAKHGVDRLADTRSLVPDVKPVGQAIPAEQLDQLNGWLASLSTSYKGLLDRLDALVTLPDAEPDEQLPALVRQALSQNADLAREFDAHAEQVRRQTLSLARIEERLDDIFHGQKGIALGLGEIKALLLQRAALPDEWELLRQTRPEAARLSVPGRKKEAQPRTIVNSIGMKLALVEPGAFLMGSPLNEADRSSDEYQHEIEITQAFYAGIYLVTQEQYERVMGVNPSWFSPTGGSRHKVKGMDTNQFPVETVTWMDAVKFCRQLTELPEEKANKRVYRLPTEAEWEYICRGGPFFKEPSPLVYFGSSLSATQANFDGNHPYGGAEKGVYLQRPTKVGSYPANPLGLNDLHGNVWEWCADWYDPTYYKRSPRLDPQGPENGDHRVLRGGSWKVISRNCRAAFRCNFAPGVRNDGNGFRVVLVVGARA